jgi:uncharacterized membrane protein
MIADDRDGAFETAIKMIFAPVWVPVYLAGVGIMKLGAALRRRKSKQEQQQGEVPVWTPVSDLERTVYAAMILAGRPVTNAELARFMNVSAGEASRRVKALEGVLRKERIGREVRISLPHLH